MRARHIATLIAFCMLIVLVSAQPFSIRANRGLNLRTAPSLNADIAETVTTGALLQVVDKVNRWLKIDRNGREVWLADWVNYSRVEAGTAGPQPASSAPANVDNCCFVDRQCSSDQEWTDGYWAFQNGQCAAPAQPQPQTSAAPLGNVPASGGNCCSLGWTCSLNWKGGVEVEQGYWVYQINQCAGLPQTSAVTLTGPVPRIEGSSRFVNHITATLKFMKSVAPAWYNYVITGMDSIVEVPVPGWNPGDVCTARAYSRERKVTLESCWIDYTQRQIGVSHPYFDQSDTAAALGHEACHNHTHEEGKHFATHEDEEAECRKFGTGAAALFKSTLSTGLDLSQGTLYFDKERVLGLLRQYCSEGYRADLFCPTLQRLEDIWRNVPYAVFPPGAPEW